MSIDGVVSARRKARLIRRKNRMTSGQDSVPGSNDSSRRTVIWHASSIVLADAGVKRIVEYNDGRLIHVDRNAEDSYRPVRQKLSDIASLALWRRASLVDAQLFSAQPPQGSVTPSAATPAADPRADTSSSRPITTRPTPPIRNAAIRKPDAMAQLAISVDGDVPPEEDDAGEASAAAGASASSGEPAPQQELREDDADTPSDVDEVAAQQAANEVMQMLRNRQASMRV